MNKYSMTTLNFLRALLIPTALLLIHGAVLANDKCIKEADITKWEVTSGNTLVAYSGDKYLAFVKFYSSHLKVGERVTLRVFSPTLCATDTVILNGQQTAIYLIEPIRQQ